MIPVYSLLLVCVPPLPSAHEAAGATGIRRSPRPLQGGRFKQRLGRIARRGRDVVSAVPRHCEPTGRANARPMTGSAKQSIKPQRKNGLLRCARNDGATSNRLWLFENSNRGYSLNTNAPHPQPSSPANTDLILRSLRSKRLEGWTQRTDSRPSFETRARARSSG